MRCKKHVADQSSTVGVCASCLRERLEELREAQGEAHAQAQTNSARATLRADAPLSSNCRTPRIEPKPEPEPRPKPNPPVLDLSRSVSPYVSPKKSKRKFYRTPPADGSAMCDGGTASSKSRHGRFWNLLNLFRFRSKNPESSSRQSCDLPPSSSAPVSPSWLSAILVVKRKNHDACDGDAGVKSPKFDSGTDNLCDEFEGRDRSISQGGLSPEYSPRRRNLTAEVSPQSVRRSRAGPAVKSLRSLAFCLSPLMRATPNRKWSHKGLGQEIGGGPVSGPGPHHTSSSAPSFCANRSRKLADFGRGFRHR